MRHMTDGPGSAPAAHDRPDPVVGRTRPALLLVVLGVIALLLAGDLLSDFMAGTDPGHLLFEGLAMLVTLGGMLHLVIAWREQRVALAREVQGRRRAEAVAGSWRAEAARWRAEAEASLSGLGQAIDVQFERWGLTPAEREVALLLLKGLAMKEVADVRGTSERTTRDQAREVYRKAGLSGRAELSAFFLEDLLVPASPRA